MTKPLSTASAARTLGRWGWWGLKAFFWICCWAVALGMAVAAAAWTIGFAPTPPVRWFYAFTAYVYLPVYALLLAAVLGRRVWLKRCCLLLVGWHLAVMAPSILPQGTHFSGGPLGAAVDDGPAVRVFYANVGKENHEFDALFDEIRAADPDVLVLTEFTRSWHSRFNATELLAAYPHYIPLARYNPAATGVYSRFPLELNIPVYQSRRVLVKTTVDAGRGRFDLYAFHGPRPVKSPLHKYDQFWELIKTELADQQGPLLLIGDFNATPYSLIYRELTRDFGLRDCHAMAGNGFATTWPNGAGWLPPIRIDHGLVSPEIRCLAAAVGVGRGSDHRPLILDLKIPAEQIPVERPDGLE